MAVEAAGLGAALPLYVTEVWCSTSPLGALHCARAAVRPGYIVTTLGDLAHTDCGVAAALLYTWITPGRDRFNGEDWFGISGSTADVDALAAAVAAAARPAPTLHVCST